MITRMPDITRLVDRLETAKLVERNRTREDRRLVLVQIRSPSVAANCWPAWIARFMNCTGKAWDT
jgi:hypothetical protein